MLAISCVVHFEKLRHNEKFIHYIIWYSIIKLFLAL